MLNINPFPISRFNFRNMLKGLLMNCNTSQWQGSRDHVEWVSDEEAARWLLTNEHELPEDLARLEDEITE